MCRQWPQAKSLELEVGELCGSQVLQISNE